MRVSAAGVRVGRGLVDAQGVEDHGGVDGFLEQRADALHALHSREVIDLAAQSDDGFDHTVFAETPHHVGRHSDKQFAVYGLYVPQATAPLGAEISRTRHRSM
ncbi:hypothetical protein [Streptomyces sp. NPDC002825]|uniref:hypothetical protein n=1 Tax=Streptomyces sp. NPDC002825 TaxID=3154666 RepID=UPI0033316E5F